MTQTVAPCPSCDKMVVFDSEPNPKLKHPDATKYWLVEKGKIVALYCNASCSLIDHEKRRKAKIDADK